MNRQQGKELFTLITTTRDDKEMNVMNGAVHAQTPFEKIPGCLLCQGVRHGLYTMREGQELDSSKGFAPYFGCTVDEAHEVLFHYYRRDNGNKNTNGQNYYQAGKELLIKYGYGDMFEETKPFSEIMAELKGETVTWEGVEVPVTGVIS